MKELKKCPVCNSEDIHEYLKTKDYFFTQEVFSLSKCNSCKLIFTNPRPIDDHLGRFYKTEKYLSHHTASFNPVTIIYKNVRKISVNKKYKLISSYKKHGSILDIGCGTGEFLSYFNKRGWISKGVEPDDAARLFANNYHGVEVNNLNFLQKETTQKFDIITMWHVLEHVPDLHSRLQHIKKLLAENAILFIAVPNILSPDAQYYNEFWAGLDVPRHLFHFSKESMHFLLKIHKMNVVTEIPMKYDALYVSWLSEQYLGHKTAFLRGIINGLRFNSQAKKSGQFSSTIFVIENEKL